MPTPRQGKQCLLQIQRGDSAEWQGISYETSNSLQTGSDTSDTATKYGGITLNTNNNYTIPVEAVYDDAPGAGLISGKDVLRMQNSNERFRWRRVFVSVTDDGAPDLTSPVFYMGGIGTFSGFGDSAGVTDSMTISGSLLVSGLLYLTSESEIPALAA